MSKGQLRSISICLGSVFVLMAAGCGDNSESSSEPKPLTKAQFTKQANAICKKTEAAGKEAAEEVGNLFQSVPTAESVKRAAAALEGTLKVAKEQVTQLAALTPPKDLQAEYKTVIASGRRAVNSFSKAVQSAPKGDVTGVISNIQQAIEEAPKSDPFFEKNGITACATG